LLLLARSKRHDGVLFPVQTCVHQQGPEEPPGTQQRERDAFPDSSEPGGGGGPDRASASVADSAAVAVAVALAVAHVDDNHWMRRMD
jgi:hypothetical protein